MKHFFILLDWGRTLQKQNLKSSNVKSQYCTCLDWNKGNPEKDVFTKIFREDIFIIIILEIIIYFNLSNEFPRMTKRFCKYEIKFHSVNYFIFQGELILTKRKNCFAFLIKRSYFSVTCRHLNGNVFGKVIVLRNMLTSLVLNWTGVECWYLIIQ